MNLIHIYRKKPARRIQVDPKKEMSTYKPYSGDGIFGLSILLLGQDQLVAQLTDQSSCDIPFNHGWLLYSLYNSLYICRHPASVYINTYPDWFMDILKLAYEIIPIPDTQCMVYLPTFIIINFYGNVGR